MMTEAVWDLQYVLDGLRLAAQKPMDDDATYSALLEFAYINFVEQDLDAGIWRLTPMGRALMAILESEDCKRRIEAVGWYWNAYKAVSEGVYISHPAETDSELFDYEVHGTNYWHAAAEYAEMQAARKEGH